jgi:hypothetical protein
LVTGVVGIVPALDIASGLVIVAGLVVLVVYTPRRAGSSPQVAEVVRA